MPTVFPSSDINAAGWTAVPPGPLFDTLNEADPSDSDYIWSRALDATTAKLGLGATVPPGTHNVNIRAYTNTGTARVRVRLLDSADNTVGVSAEQVVDIYPTTYTLAVVVSAPASRVWVEINPSPVIEDLEGALAYNDAQMYYGGGVSEPGYDFGEDFSVNYTHFPGAAGSIVNEGGGSILVTAGTSNALLANTHVLWCKRKPPSTNYCFSFDYTWLDAFDTEPPTNASTTSGGIYSQFILAYIGSTAVGVPENPNNWTPDIWQGANNETTPPNADSMYGANGYGERTSFNTQNSESPSATNNARLRGYVQSATVVPIDPTDQAFPIVRNKVYKIHVRVVGDKCSIRSTHPDTGAVYLAEWTNAHIANYSNGNYIGFRFGSGRQCRVANMHLDTWPGDTPVPYKALS